MVLPDAWEAPQNVDESSSWSLKILQPQALNIMMPQAVHLSSVLSIFESDDGSLYCVLCTFFSICEVRCFLRQ